MIQVEHASFAGLINQRKDELRPWSYVAEPVVVGDTHFHKCTFEDCRVFAPAQPERRSLFTGIKLSDCRFTNSSIYGALIDEAEVCGIKMTGRAPCYLWGAVFRHVVLRGPVTGTFLVNDTWQMHPNIPELDAAWKQANGRFYAGCDWALDVSEAQFASVPAFYGVPGRLIRRDPATQLLVTRKQAIAVDAWRSCDGGVFESLIANMLQGDQDSTILIAPTRGPKRKELLDALNRVRDAGVSSD